MNKSSQSRIIMVDGAHNELYEKAIFILKKNNVTRREKKNMVQEAEKIVEDYIQKNLKANKDYRVNNKYVYEKKKTSKLMNVLLIFNMILLIYMVISLIPNYS